MYKIFGNHAIKEAAKKKKGIFYGTKDLYKKLDLKCEFIEYNKEPFLWVKELVRYVDLPTIMKHDKLILLDQLEDPRNLGSIIRTAAVFGFHIIYKPGVLINETVVKCSSGGIEYTDIFLLKNTATTMKILEKNYWIVCLNENGENIYNKKHIQGKIILVIGSEGFGISNLILNHAHFITSIPSKTNFNILNASIAAAVGMTMFL